MNFSTWNTLGELPESTPLDGLPSGNFSTWNVLGDMPALAGGDSSSDAAAALRKRKRLRWFLTHLAKRGGRR